MAWPGNIRQLANEVHRLVAFAEVELLEQVMVRRALDRSHGRVEEASRLLGISRKGLFLKRRRWGLRQAS